MLDPTIVVAVVTTTGTLGGLIVSRRVGTGKERRQELRSAKAESRLLENALNERDALLRKHGITPPPWPLPLTDMQEGGDVK